MDLELTDEQYELRDNIRTVLEGACPPEVVRAVYEGTGTADELWKQMVDLYWPALGIAEDGGGLGFGFVEVALLAEELGRAAAPGPLLAVATQFTPMLAAAGATDLLAEVAAGDRVGALALAERGRWSLDGIETRATADGESWRIDGTKTAVVGGVHADSFVVIASVDDGIGAFLVAASDASVQVPDVLDPAIGLADVGFDRAPATAILAPGAESRAAIEGASQQAVVAMALHSVGAARRIFEVTLEYAKVREQYDRVIGSFQALKHRFADLYLAVERANAVGYFAAVSIAEDDPGRTEAVHVAKVAAGQCQQLLAEDGLQLHGGIGYTWEHDLHFWIKRAKAAGLLCGSDAFHRAELARRLGLVEGAA